MKMRFAKVRLRYWLALGFLIFAAVALTWFLQYRYFLNDAGPTWDFVFGRPLVFMYNAMLMFLMLLFLTGLTRRPIVAGGVMWALITVLTYIHINKFEARGFPLLPEDFALASEAASLAKFVDVWELVRVVLAVVLILVLTFLLNHLVARKFDLKPRKVEGQKWWRRWAVVPRLLMVVLAATLFLNLTSFVRNHHGLRYEDIPWLNSQLVAWNQVRNYDYNGFILGFLYNMGKFELSEPDGYDEARMHAIQDEYEDEAESKNGDLLDLAEEAINVVVILNESFFDPTVEFGGKSFVDYYPYTGGEILPNLHRIQRQHPSGLMYSTDYGGGTANIEFEALTGLSNFWANTVPYTDLIPRAGEIPSIASFLKSQGYGTTAIHPFNGAMYKRNIALHNFGFDRFITELEMKHTQVEGTAEYINDRSAYLETLDVLKESDGKQMVGLITMQNHLPYNWEIYGEDGVDFAVGDIDIDPGLKSDIGVYYQLLHNSDKYLGEFLDNLEMLDEKTVVLFFGDHAAGLFNLVAENDIKEVRDLSRITPYFVYSNFETGYRGKKLPTTTPNCLSNTLFNVLGSEKTRLHYLLDEVCSEVPILANTWFDNEGPFMSTALSKYELINYDLLGGEKYWAR